MMFRFPFTSAIQNIIRLGSYVRPKIRQKHDAVATNDLLSDRTYWLTPEPAITSEQLDKPVVEITSFDDFGFLSLDRSKSLETVSSAGDKTFIDTLLRYDNNFSSNNFVPTVADFKELGGSHENSNSLEMMMSGGYDFLESIDSFTDNSSLEEVVPDPLSDDLPLLLPKRMQKESSSVSFIPLERRHTRTLIQDDRLRWRSAKQVVAPEPVKEELPIEEVQGPSSYTRFDPSIRSLVCSVQELQLASRSDNITDLRNLLMEKKWPPKEESAYVLNEVLSHIVKYSTDCDEVMMFFRDFATTCRRAFIRDEHILDLAIRAVSEVGCDEAISILSQARNMFTTLPPRSKEFALRKRLEELYSVACTRGSLANGETLLDVILERGYSSEVSSFINAATKSLVDKNCSYDELFNNWTTLSSKYGNVSSLDLILEAVLLERSDKTSTRLKKVLKFCSVYQHPFVSVAELVGVLVRMGNQEDATDLMKKISVSGRYFKPILNRWKSQQEALTIVENFALLVTDTMFAEKRRRKRNKEQQDDSNEIVVTPSEVSLLVETHFCGPKNKQKTNEKVEKIKRKLHKVDEEQLHELSSQIRDVWIELAEKSDNKESAGNLLKWCLLNRVQISPTIEKRVSQIGS